MIKKYSRRFLEKTREVWQPYSPALLSLGGAEEITNNMVDLIEFLKELEMKYGKEEEDI